MNERIPVTNTTAMPMYVAGLMIPPGETRHFDAEQVPAHLRPVAADPEPEAWIDPLEAVAAQPVKAIVDLLPEMPDTDLVRLLELDEADGSPRKTLHEAVAAEQLRRASAKAEGGESDEGAGD